MFYDEIFILKKDVGNNSLSYEKRKEILGKNPQLIIPKRILGEVYDVKQSENIVFEEVENNTLVSCKGLQNFVEINRKKLPKIIIFDNHNHALYFWCEALKKGIINPGFELIHIDEHSDLWDNKNTIHSIDDCYNLKKMWNFTNFECNVGNYIQPVLKNGIISSMIRIENEYQIDEYCNYTPHENSVLNLDLDIFSEKLAHIPEGKILQCIKNLFPKVSLITIATSPYFISQQRAIGQFQKIMQFFE